MVVVVAVLAVAAGVVCFMKFLAKMLRMEAVSSTSASTDRVVMGQPCVD